MKELSLISNTFLIVNFLYFTPLLKQVITEIRKSIRHTVFFLLNQLLYILKCYIKVYIKEGGG